MVEFLEKGHKYIFLDCQKRAAEGCQMALRGQVSQGRYWDSSQTKTLKQFAEDTTQSGQTGNLVNLGKTGCLYMKRGQRKAGAGVWRKKRGSQKGKQSGVG